MGFKKRELKKLERVVRYIRNGFSCRQALKKVNLLPKSRYAKYVYAKLKRQKFKKKHKKEIFLEVYMQSKDIKKAAQEAGITLQHAYATLREKKIALEPKNRWKISEEQEKQIIELAKQGKRMYEIDKATGVSPATIRKYLKKRGLRVKK